jgi:dipeptidyl aminopeptidase/acylaminoacyl peptidase
VIAPNVRGSTGYGYEFEQANVHDLGGGDLTDYVYGARFLEATGYVDRKRIGITGGSYGGYMTLMALGKTPDAWAAGVALYGVTDWRSMLERTSPMLRMYLTGLLGDPVRNADFYRAASPSTYLDRFKAPLLVMQGADDRRTPKAEAEDLVAALEAKGRTVDAHYYAGEGHGFMKRENQVDSLQRLVAWFDRHLRPEAGAANAAR